MHNTIEHIEQIKIKISATLKQAGVTRSAIFGSFAKNKESKESDIDILVEFQEGKTLLDLVALKAKLEKILNRKVDLMTYRSLSPFLRERILKERIPIYE